MRRELRMANGEQRTENGSQPALCGKMRLTTPMSIESYRDPVRRSLFAVRGGRSPQPQSLRRGLRLRPLPDCRRPPHCPPPRWLSAEYVTELPAQSAKAWRSGWGGPRGRADKALPPVR